jgi:hypothetical protein
MQLCNTEGGQNWFRELHLCPAQPGIEDVVIALRLAIIISRAFTPPTTVVPQGGSWLVPHVSDARPTSFAIRSQAQYTCAARMQS